MMLLIQQTLKHEGVKQMGPSWLDSTQIQIWVWEPRFYRGERVLTKHVPTNVNM